MANDAENLDAKKAKIQKEKLKEYFRNVVVKQDFDYEEFVAKSAEWKDLTGEEFKFDILLDKSQQQVLEADEEILQNIHAIEQIYEEERVKRHFDDVLKKTKKRVDITDDNGEKVDNETKHDLLSSLMLVSMQEVAALNADSKDFSALSEDEKRKTILDDVEFSFHIKAASAAAASAIDVNADAQANAENSQKAAEAYMSGKKVTIKKDHIINAVSSSLIWVKDKINKFKQSGFIKSAKKLTKGVGDFVKWFNKKNLGALKDRLVQDVKENPAQWIANTGMAVGAFAATFASAPVALGAVASYALYTTVSTPLWSLNRKRKQEKKVAVQNNGDTAKWSGFNGMKNAWKAIHENPEEKKAFNRQWGIATAVGVTSAVVIGALAPSVVAATNAAEAGQVVSDLAAQASTNALSMTRLGTGLLRVAGANANATLAYKDASKKFKKTQKEEDKAVKDAAKVSLISTLLLTGGMEALAVSGAFAQVAAQPDVTAAPVAEAGLAHSAPTNGSPWFEWGSNEGPKWNPTFMNDANAAEPLGPLGGAEVVATPEPTPIEAPTSYDPSMGITPREWEAIHTVVTPGHVANYEDIYANTVNAIKAHPGCFVNPDGSAMTPEQVMWEASRVFSLSRAREVADGMEYRLFDPAGNEVFPKLDSEGNWGIFDAKGARVPDDVKCLPIIHGNEETVKAFRDLYRMINCGENVQDVNVARIKQFFDETAANGQYRGEGWNIGQTNNYMDRDGCGDIHFLHGHKPEVKIPPVEENIPVTGPELETVEVKEVTPDVTEVRGKPLGTAETITKVQTFNGSTLEGDSPNYYGEARSGSFRQGTLNGSKVTIPLTEKTR